MYETTTSLKQQLANLEAAPRGYTYKANRRILLARLRTAEARETKEANALAKLRGGK